jgi:hypothetical protein
MSQKIIYVSLLQLGIIFFLKKNKSVNLKKNNNLRKKNVEIQLARASKFGYPRAVASLSDGSHFACGFQQKALLVLDRIQAS